MPTPPKAPRPALAAVPATQAEANQFLAAYILGVANRLASSASSHYRRHFNLGMPEWRAMMAIGTSSHRIVREVAQMADLDVAAASKSLKLLTSRGLVQLELTKRRGRASIASLTPQGLAVYEQLRQSAIDRQQQLFASFAPAEIETLWSLLRRVEQQVAAMNADAAGDRAPSA
ncbi:MAG TPA: MarR family winged helix-turn-helix transcriptional regulator [Ideonella sp.]|nr:MarR family winged helix-turn-helix transcriptional regulator [Ideonella sp.]